MKNLVLKNTSTKQNSKMTENIYLGIQMFKNFKNMLEEISENGLNAENLEP